MENKQAVAVAVGVGAVGTLLAYVGYSVYNSNKDTDNLVSKKSWWKTVWRKDQENNVLYNDISKENDNQENIKLQALRKSSAWGKFWANTHSEMKDEDEDKSNKGD